MKYLVTGGTGFLGKAVTELLLEMGQEVTIYDNYFRGKNVFTEHSKLKVINGDIRDFTNLSKSMKGIDSVIHLAYINGTKNFYEIPELVVEVGIKGMLNVLEAAKNNLVNEVILFSTSEVYQEAAVIPTPEEIPLIIPDLLNPRYSYGGSKAACELMLVHLGGKVLSNWKIIRPHNIYGKNMGMDHVIPSLISKVKESKDILEVQGSGLQTRSFCYIEDFKKGIKLIINDKAKNQIYNIGTAEEVTINNLANKIMNLMNKKLTIVNKEPNKGETSRRVPDISKITKLGYKASYSLSEGLNLIIK